ncbi:alpha/beta fold hydrolase [Aeromicrobium sp. CTD01-1L150]|uniref:alpha/beta fold hydrolase n=1 Tax=Aeromicrobium sp. CTD01-1L150 TaxID=3341830 RepID=UPI0035C09C3D
MDDAALHSSVIGDSGATVVFLHGLFGQGKNFTQIAKALVPDFRSLLVDLPDHGRSPWTERFGYEQYADAVADLLGSGVARGGPVHVVGHSMGGKVAMLLALRHPELVDRLVVADISPAASDGSDEFEHLLGSLAQLDLSSLETRGEADAQLAEPIASATVRGFLLQNLRRASDGFHWQANLDLLRRDLADIGDWPAVDSSFDHPVLWVAGERSHYVRDEHDETMRRLFPQTRLVTIKGAGHWVHSEQPEAFASALKVFLAG